jgi:hypothetical protein
MLSLKIFRDRAKSIEAQANALAEKHGTNMRALLICTALAATMASASASATQYLINGGFETGDFTGWTESGNFSFTAVEPTGYDYDAQAGNYYVLEGPVGSDGYLSQTFTDTPGQTLYVSGWVIGNGGSPSDVNFNFDGATYISINPVPNQPWTRYSFTFTATGSDTFSVRFRNDPSYSGLDGFSVGTFAVPETATWAMMLAGFTGLGFAGYRASRKSAAVAA